MNKIAALYVETDGVYFGIPGIDPWDETRDARLYHGPYPVVAHPPCQRWGRFWHGSTAKPHQFSMGDDGGCFDAALAIVRRFGGVLEHPADSHAWDYFGLSRPPRSGGWVKSDCLGGFTCCVEQGHYGHISRKATWLYSNGCDLPELRWGSSGQRIHPVALERYGYEKARRIGMMAMVGGKNKTKIRNATPVEFRDILLGMAISVYATTILNPLSECGRKNRRLIMICDVCGLPIDDDEYHDYYDWSCTNFGSHDTMFVKRMRNNVVHDDCCPECKHNKKEE